jgi:post-segregation antitoxin (ccd killing protein)
MAAAMNEAEHDAALALLRDPGLIERIVADFDRIGLVGEAANTLVAYLACVSRKLDAPLALIIQSTSAAGKSALMDAALSLVPEEDRVHYSAMTGQSLFYLGETSVKHKILAIAEEEGVRQAAYALKVLQSQGELTIASTGKDPATGQLVTQEYRVEGPVMLFLTTTAIDIDEELLNRCLVLTIDESRAQTRAIQQRQRARRTLSGLIAKREQDGVLTRHRHAQRLLRPLAVVNPFAEQLTFLDDRTRTRRDHAKYLTLIEAIALLHQYQRPVKQVGRGAAGDGAPIEYIEVELTDIALANRLAHEVLGRSLDELPPQTRRLLGMIAGLVDARIAAQAIPRSEVRLTRKEIRDVSGLSDTRLRLHLDRLVEMEYLFAHAGRQGRRFVYELAFDGKTDTDAPQWIGLLDVAALEALQARGTTDTSPGSDPHFAPGSPAVRLSLAPSSPGPSNGLQPNADAARSESAPVNGQNVLFPEDARAASRSSSLAAAL